MDKHYWTMTFIQPANPDDDRCVMLYGKLDEIVGPLTVELAEAWIAQFEDNRRAAPAQHRQREQQPI